MSGGFFKSRISEKRIKFCSPSNVKPFTSFGSMKLVIFIKKKKKWKKMGKKWKKKKRLETISPNILQSNGEKINQQDK